MLTAAVVALAEHGISPDVQELLVRGDGRGRVAPGALRKAILSALSSDRRVEEWQPIKTAPKDGSYIIAAKFGANGELQWVKDTHWETAASAAESDGLTPAQADDYETGWQNADAYNDGTCGPTHWKPLNPPAIRSLPVPGGEQP